MELGGIFEKSSYNEDFVILLETNIDDMNPELYDIIFEKLYQNKALEVYITPIIMKKNRPANIISVLSNIEDKENIKNIIFRETTSIGIREQQINRSKMKRKTTIIKTIYGEVRIKIAYINNEIIKIKPEYEDCKKISMENNIPINRIYNIVMETYNNE